MTANYIHEVDRSRPIRKVELRNSKGYFDLVLNKNNNGKAIRIAQREGANDQTLYVSLTSLDSFITALQDLRDRGVKVSQQDSTSSRSSGSRFRRAA